MAHESFENEESADILNRDYICVKVDREERPDIDAVYMAVCQALTQAGGWPLTIIMTPQQKPFFAGTYLPRRSRPGMMGLNELLTDIAGLWRADRRRLLASGDDITAYLQAQSEQQVGGEPALSPAVLLQNAAKLFQKSYDPVWGGFGTAPKFPVPHNLIFLLRYSFLQKDNKAKEIAAHTLLQMYRGGIYDHIGGGFSRYSTDAGWLVPHFEKMLYDNALLAYVYTEAWQSDANLLYRKAARAALDYVLRELTDTEGGFLCGQDADSEGVEGKYYVFTVKEIKQQLGEADGELFCRWFDITEQGNFEGSNIPNLLTNPHYGSEVPAIDLLCGRLYDYRIKRTKLHKDDKILTSWNALMISAFAKAAHVFGSTAYLDAAKRAEQFIASRLMDKSGRLSVRYRDGETAHKGQLEDYAFYTNALLDLYHTTQEPYYLETGIRTAEWMIRLFLDEKSGGFYLYASDSEALITRPKEVYDGALPSGNSAAALALIRLFRLSGDIKWQELSLRQLDFVSRVMQGYPAGYSFSLLALTEANYPSAEIICSTKDSGAIKELQNYLSTIYLPGLALLSKTPANEQDLLKAAPFTAGYPIPNSGTVYYLCRNGSCLAPLSSLEDLKTQLTSL